MPDSPFSFGASGNPAQPATTPGTVAPPTQMAPQNPMAMLGQFLQMMQGGQGQQTGMQPGGLDLGKLLEQLHSVHDPQGFADKQYIPGVNNSANPFSNGFFNQSASQLSPQALASSQGANAMNQWQWGMPGMSPDPRSSAQGAIDASPQPFHIKPELAERFGIPQGIPLPAHTPGSEFTPAKPKAPAFGGTKSTPPAPKGFSFGASGNPRPNPFSF